MQKILNLYDHEQYKQYDNIDLSLKTQSCPVAVGVMLMRYIIEKGLEGVDSIDNSAYQSLIYAKNSARHRAKLCISELEGHWKLQHSLNNVLSGEYTKSDVIDVIHGLKLQDKITEALKSYISDQSATEDSAGNYKGELVAVITNNMNAVTAYSRRVVKDIEKLTELLEERTNVLIHIFNSHPLLKKYDISYMYDCIPAVPYSDLPINYDPRDIPFYFCNPLDNNIIAIFRSSVASLEERLAMGLMTRDLIYLDTYTLIVDELESIEFWINLTATELFDECAARVVNAAHL